MPNMDPKHQLIASVASTILQKQLNAHAGLVHQVLLGSSRTKGSDMVEAAEVFQATPPLTTSSGLPCLQATFGGHLLFPHHKQNFQS